MTSLIIQIILILKTVSLTTYFLSISGLILLVLGIYFYQYRKFLKKYSTSKMHYALKEKDMLKQLFDNMPDRIYFKDRESRFIIANKHVASVMGEKHPEKLIGKTDFDFYEDKYAKGYFEDEQEIMKLGKPMISKEEKGLDLDGNEIYVSTSKIPIKDRHNNVIGIIGIGRDITPQKLAENELRIMTETLQESNVLLEERQEEIQQMAEELNVQAENLRIVNTELERLSVVASKTENVVVIMDGNGNFEWVNTAFENRYSMKLDKFKKKYGVNLRENSSNENISAILSQIYITHKPYTYNAKFTVEDGSIIWNQTNITPILNSDNEITNLILIDSDITELKNAEIQINDQKVKIEKQAAELERTNATKDRLFSIIAHDLKNPFHSILGFVDLLKRGYKDIEREKLNEFLGMIQESTSSAYQLLENLLEWARTQTKNVQIKPDNVPVYEVVDDIIALQSLHASNKEITLKNEIEKDIIVFADRNMLNTVLRNLSSNAIKFTNIGGNIRFSSHKDDKNVFIEVSDSGIGIPEDKLNSLFILDNVKSNSGTSGETGTGLGLIVCAEFMKLNNGSIHAKSEPGKGSTFTLSIPIKIT